MHDVLDVVDRAVVERQRDQALRHTLAMRAHEVRERHDAPVSVGQPVEVASERNVVVFAVAGADDVVRVVGEDRERHGGNEGQGP